MRRSWLVAAIVLGLVAIVIAALAVRLTADDEASATAWADSVCASLADWRASILGLTDVSGGLDKASLGQKLNDAESATRQLVSELRDLGPPDLEQGGELEGQLDATVESLEARYETLAADARQALDEVRTPTELFQALATLAPQFRDLLESAGEAVATLRDSEVAGDARDELERAFDEAESCRELRGES